MQTGVRGQMWLQEEGLVKWRFCSSDETAPFLLWWLLSLCAESMTELSTMYVVSQVHSCLFGFVFPLFPLLGCVNPPELLLRPGTAARSFQC